MFARAESGVQVTIADFVKAGRESLQLSVIAGAKNLDKPIIEALLNRSGLAMTGFLESFAWQRIQLAGVAETEYMRSLPAGIRRQRMQNMVRKGAYCFIITHGNYPSDETIAFAEEQGVVIMVSRLPTRKFVAQATFLLERLTAPRISMYGTMIEVAGMGVMIEGDPGIGKSETALGLVKRGHAIVSDDLTCIRRDMGNNLLFASASGATAGFMEIRGIGIVNVRRIFGASAVRDEKRLELVITFKRLSDIRDTVDRIGQRREMKEILGVKVPNLIIPVSAGRDLVNLVETAVHAQKLAERGYDPVAELSEHLRIRAERTTNG